MSDDFHRRNNDIGMAVAKAGLSPALQAGTLIFNIGYGPWQSAALFHLLFANGNQLAKTLTPNKKLVLEFGLDA